MADIELKHVFKSYTRGNTVLRDVNLSVGSNEFCVFIGPSGCGKSTLLRIIAGLEEISEGDLLIDNERMNTVSPANRGVAMVFQSYALFPHMTVFENMAFGLKMAKVDVAEIERRVTEVARILQLGEYLERLPKALSGGQRQRVAIGRAIVREPQVFLFDEPLSNLDAALRVQTRYEIAKLHREFARASTIYVTHDQVEAMTLADRIVLLNAGDAVRKHGSVAQIGTPLELYHYPANQFVAGFIGSPKMNFLPATFLGVESGLTKVRLVSGEVLSAMVDGHALQPGESVTIGVRPEHAHLGNTTQHLERTVRWQERLGESTYVYFDSENDDASWVVKAPGSVNAATGERAPISLPPEHLHLFDKNGIALQRTSLIMDQSVRVH